MERLNILQAICSAILTIVDSKIAKTKFNATRIGIIVEQTNIDKGIYKVRLGDRQIYANSLNSNITYEINTLVYFLNINNQSEKFYILGSTSSEYDNGRIVELVNQAIALANEANETAAGAVNAALLAANLARNASQAAADANKAANLASSAAALAAAAISGASDVIDSIDTIVEQTLLKDTIYYLATDKSENVKVSDSGWTTTPQQISENKKYLWTYHAYLKGDGTVVKTDPVISGVYGSIGVSVIKTEEYYALSSENVAPTTGYTKDVPTPSVSQPYLWNFERVYYSDNTVKDSDPHLLLIYDGSTLGRGIANIQEYYLATNSTIAPDYDDENWQTLYDPITPEKRYLWNYECITYTDGLNPTYTQRRIIGVYGEKGANGSSVTISSILYATTETSDTPPDDEDWESTVPQTIEQGQWLWIKTTYNTGSITISKNYVGKDGLDGTSIYITGTSRVGKQITVTFSDNTQMIVYDGTDGTNGINGENGYVHIAWATEVVFEDGDIVNVIGFDVADSVGKAYMGTYTDNTLADSLDWEDYSWVKIKGLDGVGISSVREYYLATTALDPQDLPPKGTANTWSTAVSDHIIDENKPYLWNYETTYDTNGNPLISTAPALIGTYSSDGLDGKGIESITEWYLATSVSSSANLPTPFNVLPWTTAVQMTSTESKYLWNYEYITWTSGLPTSTAPAVIGTHGETGPKGEDGKDGVSITGVTNYYLATSVTSGVTTARSSWNWQDSIQPIDATTPYLWNYLLTIGLDNGSTSVISITQPVIIARYSENGQPGQGISDINLWYYISGSSSVNSVPPTSERKPSYANGWSDTPVVPTSELRYLWNFEEIFWVNPTTVTTTDPAVIGIHGQKGLDGVSPQVVQGAGSIIIIDANGSSATISDGQPGESISNVVERYLATSASMGISTTSSGWTTAVSDITLNATNCYLWNYLTTIGNKGSTLSTTTPIIIGHYGVNGTNGMNGQDGRGIDGIQEYYLATSANTGVTTADSPTTYGTWSTSMQTMNRTHNYLWNYEAIGWTAAGSTPATTSITLPGIIGMFTEGTSEVHLKYLITSADSGVTTANGAYGNWSTSVQNPTSSSPYLWNYLQVIGTGGSTLSTTNPVIIGNYAKDGDPGRGILGTTEYYLVTNSTIAPSASADWSSSPLPTSPSSPYLWNYEKIDWSSAPTPTTTSPAIIGTHGLTGNGTSAINEYYLASSKASGITTATSGWQLNNIPNINSSTPYLWNYLKTLGTIEGSVLGVTTPVIIARYTENGRGILGIQNYYLLTTGISPIPTTSDTEGWSPTILFTNASTPYLWNYLRIGWTATQSASATTSTTTPAIIGVHGMTGKGVSSIETWYNFSTSDSQMSSTEWYNTLDNFSTSAPYIWTKDIVTFDDDPPSTTATTSIYNPVLTLSWIYATSALNLATNAENIATSAEGIATSAIGIASTVAQHFWFDSEGDDTGAHITLVTEDEWKDVNNSTGYHSGSNLLANSNGIAIRSSTALKAIFSSSGVRIGSTAENHAFMSTGSFDINTSAANLASFGTSATRIGLLNDNHVLIDSDSVDIINSTNTLASFSTATWIGEKFGQRLNLDKYGMSLTIDGANDVFSMRVNDIGLLESITLNKHKNFSQNDNGIHTLTFNLKNLPVENSNIQVSGSFDYHIGTVYNSFTLNFSTSFIENLNNQEELIWELDESNYAKLQYDGLKTFTFILCLSTTEEEESIDSLNNNNNNNIEELDTTVPEEVGNGTRGGDTPILELPDDPGPPEEVGNYLSYDINIIYTAFPKTDPYFTIGREDKAHITITDNSMELLLNTTNLASFNSSSVRLGNENGKNIFLTSDVLRLRDSTATLTAIASSAVRIGLLTNQNVYINSDSVNIRNNTTALASFASSAVRIGIESTAQNHVLIDNDSVDINYGKLNLATFSSNGINFYTGDSVHSNFFTIASNGSTGYRYTTKGSVIGLPSKTITIKTDSTTYTGSYSLEYMPASTGSPFTRLVLPFTSTYFPFTPGQTTSYSNTSGAYTLQLNYDGEKTFNYTLSSTGSLLNKKITANSAYYYIVSSPYFTYGTKSAAGTTKIGSYSATFGRDLCAPYDDQFIVGRRNQHYSSDYAFVIGNGPYASGLIYRTEDPLAVTWDGLMEIALNLYATSVTWDGRLYTALSDLGWTGILT